MPKLPVIIIPQLLAIIKTCKSRPKCNKNGQGFCYAIKQRFTNV